MIAGALEVQIFAGIARLQSDMNQAKTVVGGAMKNIESAVASAKSALASLGIGLGVGYFVSLIKGTIDAADHLNDLTQSLGINARELAKYQLATAQSGTTLEGLAKGVKGIATAFAEHGDELRKVGIDAKDTDGRMRQIAEIFSNMPDGIEKTTLAVKLFGKSGMELIPMLNMGAAGLAETAEKSAKYAAVMATLAPQADKFNDIMVELGMASKVAGMAMINDALPAMSRISAAMAIAAHESNIFMVAMVGLGGFVKEGIAGWGAGLHRWWSQLNAYLDDAAAKLMRYLGLSKEAGFFANSANEFKLALQNPNGPGPDSPAAPKGFDQAAWMANYKKMMEALGLGRVDATKKTDAELAKLLALGTKGEIDALIEREKAWSDEQKAINELKNAGYDEDKKLIELGVKGEEEAALARAQIVKDELEAINDAKNAAIEAQLEKEKRANEERLREQKRLADDVDRMLGDAIMRGFERGEGFVQNFRDTLVNMFKTLVLRPIISFALSPITGGVAAALGGMGMSGSAAAAGGGLNLLSSGSSLFGGSLLGSAGAYSAITGGSAAAGSQAAMLAAQTGEFGAAGLAATAGASSGMAALASAIPYVGIALAAGGLLGLFGGGSDRTASPQMSGLGSLSSIRRGGFSGQQWVASGSSPGDLWAGSQWSDLPAEQLAGFNRSIASVFDQMETAAKSLGLETSALAQVTVSMGKTGQGVEQDMAAALAKTSDEIALALLPNLRDFQQGTETLAQTFARLATEQAALEAQHAQDVETARAKVFDAYDAEAARLAQLADSMTQFGKGLRELQQSLLLGANSPLAPMAQFAEAQRQFRDTAARAQLGDPAALAALSGASQSYLSAGRGAFSSSGSYDAVFGEVQRALGAAADTADRSASNAGTQVALLQQQVEQLAGIRAGVLTLADAMSAFSATLAAGSAHVIDAAAVAAASSAAAAAAAAAPAGSASALASVAASAALEPWQRVMSGLDMPAMPMAGGGDFWVTKPTLFLAGEAGPERATFSGADGGAANDGVLGELRALRAQVQRLTAVVAAGESANVRATQGIAQAQSDAAWRQEVKARKA